MVPHPPAPKGRSAVAEIVHAEPLLPWWQDAGLRKLFFWQACIVMSQMVVGYDEVDVGSFQAMDPWLKDMGNPDSSTIGLITAILFVGGLVGAFFASPIADHFGRRVGLFVGSSLSVIGSIIQAAAPGAGTLMGGRVILGMGISLTTSSGPSLLNELAHPRHRGTIANFFNVLWYMGSIIAAWLCFGTGHLSTTWSWRIPSIVQGVFPFLVAISTLLMPESPRWLCMRNRSEEARAILTRYHANGDSSSPLVAMEMAEITESLAVTGASTVTWAQALRSPAHRKQLGVCVAMAVLTLWTGQSVISYYFTTILNSVGVTGTNRQTGINGGMSIWNLVCSAAGALLAERVGRRPLWLASFTGMIIVNIPLTVATAMYTEHGSQGAAYVVVVCLFLYNAAFNVACNPLLYSYSTEILPLGLRTKGLGLQILLSQICLTVNQYVNPIAMERIGYWFYVFYMGMCVIAVVTVYFFFPETKGFSLEELGRIFEDVGESDIEGSRPVDATSDIVPTDNIVVEGLMGEDKDGFVV